MEWFIPSILVIGVAIGVVVARGWVAARFDALNRLLARAARVRGLPLIIVFLLAFALAAVPSLIWDLPLASIHDDFAYLLAGDTYAHGRLTNVPQKLAVFFETFHVIQSPTYMAKFPMGQGLSLAIGFLLGLPILGVWITMGLACAAVTWMLGAVMPRRWALAGGLFTILHPMTIWWGQGFSGGGVAMLGGAIFGGALLRADKAPRATWGIVLAIGLAILANSRPLEGLITSIIAITWLAWRIFHSGSIRSHVLRTILPAAIGLAFAATFMMYDDWRVTGHPLTMPYVAHQKQYMVAPLLFYQRLADPLPTYHHQVFYDFHTGDELGEYRKQIGWDHAPSLGSIIYKWRTVFSNFVNLFPVGALLIGAGIAAVRRDRAARVGIAVCLLLPMAHTIVTPWFRPAYLAPAMGFLMLLFAIGMRALPRQFPRAGMLIVRVVIIVQLLGWYMWARALNRLGRPPTAVTRAALVASLEFIEGKHLVLVRYGPGHSPLYDVVSNGADIDGSKVIWARSMGDATDKELIEHFKDRTLWPLEFDEKRLPVVRRWSVGEWP